MMKSGGYFHKHDFGRQKRGRKHLKLSLDGLKITWKSVGANEVIPDGGSTDRSSPSRGILRSASFSRTTSSAQWGTGASLEGPAVMGFTLALSSEMRAFGPNFVHPAVTLSDVSHIIYGPYTDTFAKKTSHDRVDARWACFSLVLRESRTVRNDSAGVNACALLASR